MRINKTVVHLNFFVMLFFFSLGILVHSNAMAAGASPVYRLYAPSINKHFFTMFTAERNHLRASGAWKEEGVAWFCYSAQYRPQGVRPVFRYYNSRTNQHLFTISTNERNHLYYDKEWKDEGVAWYAYGPEQKPPNAVPVYRLRSGQTGFYLYTTHTAEKYRLMSSGWVFEGIAWYAFPQ